jgi:hypothetical protein
MVSIHMTDQEADTLMNVLDAWLEGQADCFEDVIKDRSLDTPEMLLQAVLGLDDDHRTLVLLRDQIAQQTKAAA